MIGIMWYLNAPDAIDYAKYRSRAHDVVITVYDAAGKVIEVHRRKSDFKRTMTNYDRIACFQRNNKAAACELAPGAERRFLEAVLIHKDRPGFESP